MFTSSSAGLPEKKAGRRTPIRLGTALIAAVGLLLGPLALAASATTTPHATTPVQGSYVPVTPFRITDTRTSSGAPNAGMTLAAAGTLNVQVTGLGTVPAGASAAVLNVTAVDPTASGFLTVFPEGTTMPLVSSLNFTPGVNVANLVTVPLSSAGGVSIYNSAGSTNVVVDAEGYYTSTPSINGSGLYNAISPVRALGTLQHGATVAANTSVPVTVTGTLIGVPATATAVVANVTAAFGTASSFLTVYPAGVTMPTASNLNFVADQVVANRVTVGVGTGGQIEVYNHTGTVSVDLDVDGYYTGAGGTGSVFVPITPVRVADTRTASLVGTETPIAASTSESFSIATTASGIPASATSVAANFTVVAGDAPGYLTAYPTSDTTNPVASDVNWVANEIVPNFTIADTAGTGSVEVYNSHGATVNVVIDAFGYFTTSSNGPIMVSATVTDTSIAITYNEGVTCPTLANAQLDFAYYYTGSASGVTSTSAVACVGDVLTLTGVFTLPGSTGGSIVYTAPATNSAAASVSATSNATYAATQTLALTAAVAPAMVSAYTTSSKLVITYNEDVTCQTGAAAALAYDYTGVASGFTGTVSAACSGDVLTLTATSVNPPGSGANIVYTAPATNSATVSVSATGSLTPVLYAATQTLSGSAWTTPAMVSAVVTPGASGTGQIVVTYNEAVTCPSTAGNVQMDFEYSNGGTPAYPSTCTASAGVLTLKTFVTATTGITGETLVLPGSADTLVYSVPATDTAVYAVNATVDFPQFPVAQTLALTATPVPAMVSAVVTAGTSIAITYNEGVSCPATGADSAFVYDYTTGISGGTATGCSTVGDVLTLTGALNAPMGSASIVYTAPGAPTTSDAVYATGSTTDFAATQTLLPL